MKPRTQAAALALLAVTAAHAETSPWYVGAAQGFTHTSNVRLVPDGQAAQGATIGVTTLLAGLDQPFGRQRATAGLTLRHLAYSGASDLNNASYDLNLGLDWATVERLSGRVSAQASRRLDQLSVLDQGALVGLKNLQDTRALNAVARLGVVTALSLEASLGWRDQKLSLGALSGQEFRATSASLGGRYRFSGALSAGAALRHNEYLYPNFRPSADRVKRNDLDLTANWVASGASTLNGRISLGRSRHSVDSQPGFSGLTGQLGWLWKPTGKIKLDSSIQRDTGVESDVRYVDSRQNVATLVDDSRLTTSLATRVTYEVTGKINATASLRLAQRDLTRNSLAINDHSQSLALGLTWAPTRTVLVGCDLSKDQRDSSDDVQLRPYGVNTFGCYVQLVLQ